MRVAAAPHSEEAAKSVGEELMKSMDSVYRKEFQEIVNTSRSQVDKLKRLQG